MYIPEAFKLNKFKDVKIPSNKDYFGRVGLQSVGDPSQYTGDEPATMPQSKMDQIYEADVQFRNELNNPSE